MQSGETEGPAGKSAGPSISRQIAGWVAGLSPDDIPERAHHGGRRSFLDVLGVSIAGSAHPTARSARQIVLQHYAPGPASLLSATRGSVSPLGAALANGVAAHVLDFDDVSYEGMAHSSCVVFPAALAAAEAVDASGEALLAAFIAGCEVHYALGRAFTAEMFWNGWWTTGLLGSIGAAAASAKVMGLSEDAIARAIGFAAAQATSAKTVIGTPVKPYACGRAAEAGVHAALYAAAGLTAPEQAFEDDNGMAVLMNGGMLHRGEIARLGRRWVHDDAVAFKMFPLCSAAQAAAEAAQQLARLDDVDFDSVVRLVCRVTPVVAGHLEFPSPKSVTEAQFSLPFAVGCALRHGSITVGHLNQATLEDAALKRLMAKVEMHVAEELAATPEQRRDAPEAAIVEAHLADGRVLTRTMPAATGMPGNPPSDSTLREKFLACMSHVAAGREDRVTARTIADRILEPGRMPSARSLTALLADRAAFPANARGSG